MLKISLKAARVNCGMSQTMAANRLGVSKTTLHHYETGKTCPNSNIIRQMETLYGIEYNDLYFSPTVNSN